MTSAGPERSRLPSGGMAPPSSRLRDRLSAVRRRVRRVVLARRRLLAALLAALAVVTGVRASALPAVETVGVLVAARDLGAGRTLGSQDLTVARLPVASVPAGSLAGSAAQPEKLAGRTLAAPLREGEPVTDVRLVAPGLLAGYPGLVAAPVRVADAAVVDLLAVGDRVDLLAVSPDGGDAALVADAAPVVAVPEPADQNGLVGGALVVVAVTESVARLLAQASVRAVVSVVLGG